MVTIVMKYNGRKKSSASRLFINKLYTREFYVPADEDEVYEVDDSALLEQDEDQPDLIDMANEQVSLIEPDETE